jgi:putative oxidoreductase
MESMLKGFVPALGRLLMAVLFIPSGVSKLGGHERTVAPIAAHGLPLPEVGYVIALAAEIVLALALLAGFQARIVALLLALYTLATAVFFHNHLGDQAQAVNFVKNLAIAGGLLFILAFGAGSWSLDQLLGRPK